MAATGGGHQLTRINASAFLDINGDAITVTPSSASWRLDIDEHRTLDKERENREASIQINSKASFRVGFLKLFCKIDPPGAHSDAVLTGTRIGTLRIVDLIDWVILAMRETAGMKNEDLEDEQLLKPGAYSLREMALIRQEEENEIGKNRVEMANH